MRSPPNWLELVRLMGGASGRILWRIRVPAAMPGFASSLRLAAFYVPTGAIIGEWVGPLEAWAISCFWRMAARRAT